MSKKILDFLKKPGLLFISLGHRGWFHWMNDELYLKIAYRIKMGKKLHLNPPVTFNEKLQWLNHHYIRELPAEKVAGYLAWHMQDQNINTSNGPSLESIVENAWRAL